MEYVDIERVLEIIENGEYVGIETHVTPIGSKGWTQYDVTTNSGGVIRLFHTNQVCFLKESVHISLFIPAIYSKKLIFKDVCKSDDVLFDRVLNAWKKVRNECKNKKKDEYSKFF